MSYLETPVRHINRYEGVVVSVRVDQARLSDGRLTLREVVEHPGGVAILPLEDDGRVWCVRQFRYPFGRELLELPAGKLEPGEAPAVCAARELSEETGFEAACLRPLGCSYSSPGISTEVIHLFLATGLRPGPAHPDDGELLGVEAHPLSALVQAVLRGELCDAKSVAAILKTARLLEETE